MTKTRSVFISEFGAVWTHAAGSEPIANRLSEGEVGLDVFFEAVYGLRSEAPVPVLFIATVDSSWTQFWSIFCIVDPFAVRFRYELAITVDLFASSQLFTETRTVKSDLASTTFLNGSIETFKASFFHFSFNNLINLQILGILQTIEIKFLVVGILDNSGDTVEAISYFFKVYVKWAGRVTELRASLGWAMLGAFFSLLCHVS